MVPARLEPLDRQSRAGPDRLSVRYAPVADAGKPDPRRLESQAYGYRAGRGAAPPLFAHRLLFVRGQEPVPAHARSAVRTPDRLFDAGSRRPYVPARCRREGQEFLGDAQRPAPRARMVRTGL